MKNYLNYSLRKKENKNLSERLNLKYIDLEYPESYFRNNDKIVSNNLLNDINKIINDYKIKKIYLPLGVGYHHDHLLTFELLNKVNCNKIFYFDYPYCSYTLATKTRLSDFGIFEEFVKLKDIVQFFDNKIYPPFIRIFHIFKNLLRYLFNLIYFNFFNRIYNYKILNYKIDINKKFDIISRYNSQIEPVFGSISLLKQHLNNNQYEKTIILEENNNKEHKITFILYLLPYLAVFKIFSYTIPNILLMFLMVIFVLTLKIENRNLIYSKKNNIKNIYFIIPVYNEESNIKSFIRSLKYNSRVKYLLIDDCSTDNSLKLLSNIKRNDLIILKRKTKANIVAQVLNIGYDYLKNNYIFEDNIYIGVLNCDCKVEENFILNTIELLEKNSIDVLNYRNKSLSNTNWIQWIANEEKDFKFNLSKFGKVNLNNGYLIRSTKFLRFRNSWTEDLVLGNEIKGLKHQSELIVYDNVPNKLVKLLNQKFRWIRGDIYYRICKLPNNIFDLVINIYYLIPMYFLLSLIFNYKWLVYDLLFVVLIESLLYYNFTGRISFSYSITQQIINLLFYIHLILFPFKW